MTTGVVKWFNPKKGYGFISTGETEGDVFVHFSNINSDGFKTLNVEDEVEFEVTDGKRGKEAVNVSVTKPGRNQTRQSWHDDDGGDSRDRGLPGFKKAQGYRNGNPHRPRHAPEKRW